MKKFNSAAVLRRWRNLLESAGYSIHGSFAQRSQSILQGSLAAIKSRGKPDQFHVTLDILVKDDYLGEDKYEVCFRGFLTENSVLTRGNYREIRLEEIEEAGRQVSAFALQWLNAYLQPEAVIALIRKAVSQRCRIEDLHRLPQASSPAVQELVKWACGGFAPSAPFHYWKFLSLLQEHVGDKKKAAKSLCNWYAHARSFETRNRAAVFGNLKRSGSTHPIDAGLETDMFALRDRRRFRNLQLRLKLQRCAQSPRHEAQLLCSFQQIQSPLAFLG